jgi:hypothetical protein
MTIKEKLGFIGTMFMVGVLFYLLDLILTALYAPLK